MSTELLKTITRPPFANYDIVVYFGGGLFFLPILFHYYISPFNLRLPKFQFVSDTPWANDIISSLCLIFSVYIIGHAIAYFSSQIIERSVESFSGKTSSTVLSTSLSLPGSRNNVLRSLITKQFKNSFRTYNWLASSFRIAPHIPLMPFYFLLYIFGIFGAFSSRIPSTIIDKAKLRLSERQYREIIISESESWFKPVEHYVINKNPAAIPRMYNYLIISGLFRSMSLIFLIVIWAEIYYFLHHYITGHDHVALFMSDTHETFAKMNAFLVAISAYFFSLFSFIKFQRRYVEETIFAFVFGD